MILDVITPACSEAELAAALEQIAGWPPSLHNQMIEELRRKTNRAPGGLKAQLRRIIKKRATTKYARLKLREFIVQSGIKGRIERDELIIPDPLIPGEEIIVRDAKLLGSRPIVEKISGFAHPIDHYIVALIGDANIKPHLITNAEIKKLADTLCDCDDAREIAAGLLNRPNIAAFEEALKDESYKELLIALRVNVRFSMVENAGQIVVFDNKTRVAYTRDEFKAKTAPEFEFVRVGKAIKRVPRWKIWFEHPSRVLCQSVTFAPLGRDKHGRAKDLSSAFNLWTDFAQYGAAGHWDLLKAHIKTILCREDEACYQYVLNWLAHLFQKPWEKPGVAIVCWGDKRTGKGTVADAIREAVGHDLSRMYTQKEHVVGRFSGAAQPPLFNQIEEAVFARDPREEGPLKSKITDPTETVELKFKTPYEVPSFSRFWFNSNSSTPVPMTFDEERYLVLHVSNAHANDHAYFDAIRKQLYHDGGLAAMVDELMRRDLSSFNVRKPPRTEHRASMVLEMLTHQDRAIADILIEGEVALFDIGEGSAEKSVALSETTPTWVDKALVRAVLNDAFRRYGAKEASMSDIARVLTEMGIIDGERNAHKARGQNAGYRFLPLRQSRMNFAKKRHLDPDHFRAARLEFGPMDEIRSIVEAAVAWSQKFDLQEGQPQDFAAIQAAIFELKDRVDTPTNDNSRPLRAHSR